MTQQIYFSLTAIGILLISNHNSFKVAFDKIAAVYFTALPQTPYMDLRGLLLRERRGGRAEGKSKEGGRGDRRAGEGRGREGRGKGRGEPCRHLFTSTSSAGPANSRRGAARRGYYDASC